MQTPSKSIEAHPIFPSSLALPLRIIPPSLQNSALVSALNRIFHEDLKGGDLDFMQDKNLCITVEDIGTEFLLSYDQGRFIAGDKNKKADLLLKGTVYNYLLLASRREDTDTLFFSRRLHMQGDTELGLYVKNFLDGMDMDSHEIPGYLESILKKALPVYERLFR